jgi:hypothetical protein
MSYTEGTAQYNNTLAGLLRINDKNLSDVEASDLIQPKAFMSILPFITASQGTQHHWTVRTVAPGVGFRELNAGILNTAAKEKSITANLKLLDASFDRDWKSPVSPRLTLEQYMNRESMLSIDAALAAANKQFIQGGTGGAAAAGYDGLFDILNLWGDLGFDLGGDGGTRVYMLSLAPNRICGVIGGESAGSEGNIEVGNMYMIRDKDAEGKTHDRYRIPISGWMGMQIAGSYSGSVAFNIDGTSGKTVDDDLLSEMYSAFPSDHNQAVNCILMSRVGLKQLRDSRVTDLVPNPDFPSAWGGSGRQIPIVVDDAVNDDEAVNES